MTTTDRHSAVGQIDFAGLFALLTNEFPACDVTFFADPVRVRPIRERPLTADRVREVLRRVHAEVEAAGSGQQVTVEADGHHFRLVRSSGLQNVELNLLERERLASPWVTGLDPVPHAAIATALRTRGLRRRLLDSGAHTYESLAEGRGASTEATRQFVRRARNKGELITVRTNDRTYIPHFQLDDVLDVRDELVPLISVLAEAGEVGWAAWTWLVSPSGWLDGAVPAELARTTPEVVMDALTERVSNLA